MLNFVRRLREQRSDKKWNEGVEALTSLLTETLPLGHARPLVQPSAMYRVTADMPYQGPYLDESLMPARLPDGTLLDTYLIDGFAIDGLWLGYDVVVCNLYLQLQLPERRNRFPHPLTLLPVYEFTPAMADILQKTSPADEHYYKYVYCVERPEGYELLTREMFAEQYSWDRPKLATRGILPSRSAAHAGQHNLKRAA